MNIILFFIITLLSFISYYYYCVDLWSLRGWMVFIVDLGLELGGSNLELSGSRSHWIGKIGLLCFCRCFRCLCFFHWDLIFLLWGCLRLHWFLQVSAILTLLFLLFRILGWCIWWIPLGNPGTFMDLCSMIFESWLDRQ